MSISFCRENKSLFNNLDTKRLSITNVSGKLLRRFFLIKIQLKTKLHLLRNKTKIGSHKNLVVETFNKLFANIVPSLGLQCKDDLLVTTYPRTLWKKSLKNLNSTKYYCNNET